MLSPFCFSWASCSFPPVLRMMMFSSNQKLMLLSGFNVIGLGSVAMINRLLQTAFALPSARLGRIFLVLFLCSSTVASANPLLALGVWLASDIGIAAQISVAIHSGIAAIAFNNNQPASVDAAALTVMLNPSAELPNRPADYTGPVYPNFQPVPPATAAGVSSYSDGNGTYFTSLNSAWHAAVSANSCHLSEFNTLSSSQTSTNWSLTYTVSAGQCAAAPTFHFETPTTVTGLIGSACATGYAGAPCALTDASIVQKPSNSKRAITRVGDTFVADPLQTADSLPVNAVISPSNVVTVTDSSGANAVATINASDHTTTLTTTVPTAGNTTTTSTTNFSAPDGATGAVQVTGQSSNTFNGQGSLVSGTPNPPSTPASPLDISGLATHGDVAAVGTKVDSTNTKLDTLNANLDPTAAAAALPAAQAAQITSLDTVFDNLSTAITAAPADAASALGSFLDWSFVMPACDCVNLTIDYKGHHAEWDWCQYIAMIKDALGYVFYVLTGIALLSILTRKTS